MRYSRKSEVPKENTAYRVEQRRLYNILMKLGFHGVMEYPYTVYDFINRRKRQYQADIQINSDPITLIEIQGSIHNKKKQSLKDSLKRNTTLRNGYYQLVCDADFALKAEPEDILNWYVTESVKYMMDMVKE